MIALKSSPRIRFQDLSRLHLSIRAELEGAFSQILETSAFIQGVHVEAFEKNFAAFTGSKHCLGVSNGTDALEIALEVLGIGKGDHVAVPSMTFVATAEAVVRQGAIPVLLDCNPHTLCVSAEILHKALRQYKLKAFIAVHLYGRISEMEEIREIANAHGVLLIEDCAQAHGARGAASYGTAGTFSFYPGKNLGGFGDAGAIATNDEVFFKKAKLLRDHGRTQKYVHERIGRNARLDGLQAALLNVKLKYLPGWVRQRQELANAYYDGLKDISQVELLQRPDNEELHAYHLFVIRVRNFRDQLMHYLNEQGIETGIHYPLGVHMQPAFAEYKPNVPLPHTEQATQEVLSLPLDPLMTRNEVIQVCSAVRSFFERV